MSKFEQHLPIVSEIKRTIQSKHSGKLINLTISGAHLYGFPSLDSDIDVRGSFLTNANNFLGLHNPKQELRFDKNNYDVVVAEIGKELNLAISGNCNVLEHFFAPQVYTTEEFLRLQDILQDTMHKKGLYNSYKGMATFNYKKFILGGKHTIKKYLYVLRALMCGIHTLETGVVRANILEINKLRFNNPVIEELIMVKSKGRENDFLNNNLQKSIIETSIDKLFVEIDEVYKQSPLPETPNPDSVALVDSELKKIRRDMLLKEL